MFTCCRITWPPVLMVASKWCSEKSALNSWPSELARRLENPRLLQDPPPYRPGAALRGPEHLRVAIDGIA